MKRTEQLNNAFLQVSCTTQGLSVWVQNESYSCARAGQAISVSVWMNGWVYNGQLICPVCADFCSDCPLPHEIHSMNTTKSVRLGKIQPFQVYLGGCVFDIII